jgi:hypothetical protein
MQKKLWFVSNFEHGNFVINEKYHTNIVSIQTIMLALWFFKHTKMQFYITSTHLGGSFYCDFTLLGPTHSLESFQILPNDHNRNWIFMKLCYQFKIFGWPYLHDNAWFDEQHKPAVKIQVRHLQDRGWNSLPTNLCEFDLLFILGVLFSSLLLISSPILVKLGTKNPSLGITI